MKKVSVAIIGTQRTRRAHSHAWNSAARFVDAGMRPALRVALCVLVAAIGMGAALGCTAVASLGIPPTDEPPGVGAQAEKGYAASEPVLAAIEHYRADHGAYTQSLAQLVPEYLPAVPGKADGLEFSFSSTGDDYSFSFHYLGPGMNTCTYVPRTGWHCSGAF
jgi:hypothetical protein